eukprot:CAMPEP_0206152564 /NCGR_PEP_ID=MMETSP1473-20131121/39391_1 /ASSEMBLY_ACC=CAM_ASM_001109 /TAXON_ID=1461547 /ORGANISM="Stichococcus sp, Strain RCC1054" /LENGTH=720 /DNA_ID=CAMNT_0053550125 /DNA_START=128 /DNA_END=2291 /DNA_ORIENTATION=+
MEAAMKIKRDAEEMNQCLQDLMQWSEKQKKLDRELKETSSMGVKGDAAVEEVVKRNIDAFRDPTEKPGPSAPTGKKAKSSSGFRFALPRANSPGKTKALHGGKGKSAQSPPSTPDQIPVVRATSPAEPAANSHSAAAHQTSPTSPAARAAADKHRERGNRLFQGGDYQAARDAYTASIAAAPGAPALSNRALMALKLRDWAAAELDASAAVDLDVGAWKAWQRRAAARLQLGSPEKVLAAVEDLEAALRLQPTSRALAAERTAAVAAYHALPALPGAAPRPSAARPVRITSASSESTSTTSAAHPTDVAASTAGVTACAAAATSPTVAVRGSDGAAPVSASAANAVAESDAVSGKAAGGAPEPTSAPVPEPAHVAPPQRLHSGCEIEEVEEDEVQHQGGEAGGRDSVQQGEPQEENQAQDAAQQSPSSPATANGVEVRATAADAARASDSGLTGVPPELRQQTEPKSAPQPVSAPAPTLPPQSSAGAGAAPGAISVTLGGGKEPGVCSPDIASSNANSSAGRATVPVAIDASATAQAVPAAGPGVSPPTAQSVPAAAAVTAAQGRGTPAPEAAAAFAASQTKLSKPRSGVDFEKTWRMLLKRPEQQAAYLAMVDPVQLPNLLRTQLTAPILESLLPPLLRLAANTTADPSAGAHALALLRALPALPRFMLVGMSVPPSHRAPLAACWDETAVKLVAASTPAARDAGELLGLLRPQFAAIL